MISFNTHGHIAVAAILSAIYTFLEYMGKKPPNFAHIVFI